MKSMRRELISEIFRAALQKWVDERGRGSQAWLARATGLTPSQINDCLKGRRGGPEENRRKICRVIGVDYEAFLERGRELLGLSREEEEESFPHAQEIRRFPAFSDERAWAIMLAACEHAGIESPMLNYTATSIGQADPDYLKYVNAGLSDKEFFDLCLEKVQKRARLIDEQMEKIVKIRAQLGL